MSDAENLLKAVRIISVQEAAKNSVHLHLEAVGWDLKYKAGQFLTFVFRGTRGEKRRSYSLTSASELGEQPRITVKKIDNGEFSRPLNYESQAGDLLYVTGVHGLFLLPENPQGHFFFLAAGSGIAPCFPMIRVLLATSTCKVTLVYSNKNEEQAIFLREIREMETLYPGRFKTHLLFSESNKLSHRRLGNLLLQKILNDYVQPGESVRYYLCGPFEFMQMCRIVLLTHTEAANIYTESFDHSPRVILPRPPDEAAHQVQVHIAGHHYELTVQYPLSVTKEASRQGIALPYSCEAGRCGSCIATITRGQFWMAYNEVLTDRDVEQGRILACQAFPIHGNAALSFE